MSTYDFWRAVIAGFFATYVMTVAAAWQHAIGIHPHDPAAFMAQSLDPLGSGRGWAWGSFYHYMNGLALALVYARWIHGRLSFHPLVLANLYGLGLVVVAMGILAPLLAPEQVGFFALKTDHALNFTLGSILAHAAYGTTLGLFYLPEQRRAAAVGVEEEKEERARVVSKLRERA